MGSIVQDKYEKGCYYVDGQTWQVCVLPVAHTASISTQDVAVWHLCGQRALPDIVLCRCAGLHTQCLSTYAGWHTLHAAQGSGLWQLQQRGVGSGQ